MKPKEGRDSKGRFLKEFIPWNKGLTKKDNPLISKIGFQKGRISPNKGKFWGVIKKCLVCKKEFKVPQCRKNTAKFCSRKCHYKYRTGRALSEKHRKNISQSLLVEGMKEMLGRKWRGKRPYNYIKDRSKIKRQDRKDNPLYKEWRIKVYKRDNYKCRINNQDCNGRIEAHHIKSWSNYPELRYDINNGITLCRYHHPKKRVEEQSLEEFFSSLIAQSNN